MNYPLLELCKEHTQEGSMIVDIGVHWGQELFPLAEHIGTTGYIWGFEANQQLAFDLLAQVASRRLANVTIENLGVHSSSGVREFFLSPANDAASNTFEPALVEDHNRRHPGIFTDPGMKKVLVKTVSLDDYFQNQRIDFIKCDAQGSDPYIISGARRIITTWRPGMIYEWEGSVSDALSEESFTFLSAHSYHLYRIKGSELIEVRTAEDMYCSKYIKFDLLCLPSTS